MTASMHKLQKLSERWKSKDMFPVDKAVIRRLGKAVERAMNSIRRASFETSRLGRRRRASKGWRKHVRRVKAAKRRMRT